MANYNTTATVTVSMNGKQAEQALKALEAKAKDLRKAINEESMKPNPDSKALARLQRELTQTERILNTTRSRARSLESTLNNLNSAAPHELKKALKEMERGLKAIPRGSQAWKDQIRQIQRVRTELKKVNEEMDVQMSFFQKAGNLIGGLGMAYSAKEIFGRSIQVIEDAVDAYASIQEEMAGVQKFTGLSADETARLNEEFKKMDTRTSLEDLNRMAQEAGRLGKTSIDDILQYVRASDVIGVALDDLGEGATLTLSKLTGIFGIEEKMGTEASLKAVGSVINDLSQNCSASAPYLAEFASRMGGVAANARMTIPQIMGLAAVLDSNNQNLEASSTAVSQVIVRMMADPAKYARVAGLEVKHFASMLKTDVNGAFIEFLDKLNQAGNMDVLSPMFKDMGENGAAPSPPCQPSPPRLRM